jgi:hypothetical protein
MSMRVCYIDYHEARLCSYLVIQIETLLHQLELFYFHFWPIYWLSSVVPHRHVRSDLVSQPPCSLTRMEINSIRAGRLSPSCVEVRNVCSRNVKCKESACLPINHNNKNNSINIQTGNNQTAFTVRTTEEACAVGFGDLPFLRVYRPPPPQTSLLLPVLFPSGHKEGLAGKLRWIKIHFMSQLLTSAEQSHWPQIAHPLHSENYRFRTAAEDAQ